MKKRQVWFEVVTVLRRDSDNKIAEWYPGDKLPSERDAKALAVQQRKQFKQEYQVIRVTIDEIG